MPLQRRLEIKTVDTAFRRGNFIPAILGLPDWIVRLLTGRVVGVLTLLPELTPCVDRGPQSCQSPLSVRHPLPEY